MVHTFQFPNERKNHLEDKHEPACTVSLDTIMTHNSQTKGKKNMAKRKRYKPSNQSAET
jgi:hypothetical protein